MCSWERFRWRTSGYWELWFRLSEVGTRLWLVGVTFLVSLWLPLGLWLSCLDHAEQSGAASFACSSWLKTRIWGCHLGRWIHHLVSCFEDETLSSPSLSFFFSRNLLLQTEVWLCFCLSSLASWFCTRLWYRDQAQGQEDKSCLHR